MTVAVAADVALKCGMMDADELVAVDRKASKKSEAERLTRVASRCYKDARRIGTERADGGEQSSSTVIREGIERR